MNLQSMITNDWVEILKDEFTKEYFINLQEFLNAEYKTKLIYPPKDMIFNALNMTSYQDTKVVIVGQDPYHGDYQAHGLAFSVQDGITPPPSLLNIYKELQSDIGIPLAKHGNLTQWANQGVLLINTVLTVQAHKANSHRNIGWEIFTDSIIRHLNTRKKTVIFVFWGKPAQKLERLINGKQHLVLKAPHPSPLSSYRGFFGCKHFSTINTFLSNSNQSTINWNL